MVVDLLHKIILNKLKSNIANNITDDQINGNISIYVNHDHNITSVVTDYRNLVLKDQDKILMNITT